jgi:perosamine synthetase
MGTIGERQKAKGESLNPNTENQKPKTKNQSPLPAIAGGEPIKTTPFGKETRYGEEELEELREALAQGTLFYTNGQKVKQLEAAFAEANGVRYAVACSSGTAGIHAALMAIGISPGDEVITAPITDMGTVIPILFQGAVPVFADLLPHTYNLDPASVAERITPRTRAILAVNLAGNACDLHALRELCTQHDLRLIEDCAQALGCRYDGNPIGTWGDIGCFSLNEFKHISCGDGGIVITDDPELAHRLRLATDKAYNRQPNAPQRNPTFLANNYRMTELQAAVAVAQLRKLPSIVERRRDWCGALSERLTGLDGLHLPEITPGCDPSWWFFMMRVEPETLRADADTFAQALQKEKLPVGAHYIGQCVYEYPVFTEQSFFARGFHSGMAFGQPYTKGLCPTAEAILDTAVMLSINEAYTETDLNETAQAIERVVRWLKRS